MDIGPTELIMVLAVVLLIFGGSRLPQLARSLGEAQREFRKSSTSDITAPEVDGPRPSTSDSQVAGPTA